MSTVPEGHPGDHAWRLPVWRTLLKLQLVKPEQLEPVNQKAKAGGFFVSHLVALGVNPDKLLTSVAIATGLPSAPRLEVRRPKAELGAGLDPAQLRALLASPFRKDAELHLAFVVPLPPERTAALPPHKAYVALEADIRDGLEALFPTKGKKGAAAPEFDPFFVELPPPPSAPRATGRAPSAEDLKRAGLVETHTHGRDELLNSLGRLKWVGAAALGLLVLVKGASWIIESSRNEAERSGAELRQGMSAASVEAAKAQQRALQAGGKTPRVGTLDELTTAMAECDVAARKTDGRGFAAACLKVADALKAYAPMAISVRQSGPLNALAFQTLQLCERETPGDWQPLRDQIQTVLKGDP